MCLMLSLRLRNDLFMYGLLLNCYPFVTNRWLFDTLRLRTVIVDRNLNNKIDSPIGPSGCSNWPARLDGATKLRPTPERPLAMGDQRGQR